MKCLRTSGQLILSKYGQGITKATVGAVTLGALLTKTSANGRIPDDFAHTYFKLESKRTDHFYDGTKIEDYAFRSTQTQPGETHDYGSRTRQFVYWLIKASHEDGRVGSVFWEAGVRSCFERISWQCRSTTLCGLRSTCFRRPSSGPLARLSYGLDCNPANFLQYQSALIGWKTLGSLTPTARTALKR
jgi:hypothetical protein